MARSRVELFEAIRRDHRREGLSIRGLADRHGVHRRTVRKALASAAPPPRKVPVRAAPRRDPARAVIDAMLREDLDAPRKQRHTARRVHSRLLAEHGQREITYSTVRDYLRVRRPEIERQPPDRPCGLLGAAGVIDPRHKVQGKASQEQHAA